MAKQAPFRPIVATETEYSIFATHAGEENVGGRQLDGNVVCYLLDTCTPEGVETTSHDSSSQMWTNGWRVYKDIGSILEVSIAESLDHDTVLAQEYGANETVDGMLRRGVQHGVIHNYAIRNRAMHIARAPEPERNNQLISVESNGHHNNWGVPRGALNIDAEALRIFGVQAAIRSLLIGTGAILLPDVSEELKVPSGGKPLFSLSQKAPFIEDSYSTASCSRRPVVSLRDEPLAQGDLWARVHDSSHEHTPSPWSKRMALGMGSVGLAMRYYGVEFDYPVEYWDLHGLMRRVAFDMPDPQSFAYGDSIREALEMHKTFVRQGRTLHDKVDLGRDVAWTLDEWARAVEDFAESPAKLADRNDHIAKRIMLNKVAKQKGLAWDDPALEKEDRMWDARGGYAEARMQTRWAEWMPSREAIERSKTVPPQNTRAKARSTAIRQVTRRFGWIGDTWATWESISLPAGRIMMPNPLQTEVNITAAMREGFVNYKAQCNADEFRKQQQKARERRERNERRNKSRPRRH